MAIFAPRINVGVTYGADNLAVADLNGDGYSDLIAANMYPNALFVLLNNGDGTFSTPVKIATVLGPTSITVTDLNGDGIPDIAMGSQNTRSVDLLIGTGDGAFTQKPSLLVGRLYSSNVGDLNGDGKADVITTDFEGNSISIMLGDGNGTYQTAKTIAAGAGADAIAIADLDNDGKNDIVVSNYNGSSVSVLLGNGDGSVQAQTQYAVAGAPVAIGVGDFDRDGNLDLVTANSTGDNVSVLLGAGGGKFRTQVLYAAGTKPRSIAVGDFNGDGISDLFVSDSANASLLLGNGDGTFQKPMQYAAGLISGRAQTGDFNGDGKTDVAVLDIGYGFAVIYLNVDDAPSIMSAARASQSENVSILQSVYKVAASDANPQALVSYSISGGEDASLFKINASTGEVTFKSAPDFEKPADAGANNIYQIVVRASDGSFYSEKSVAITVLNVAESGKSERDFNHDGYSDIYLQNASNGVCYVWNLNGKAVTTSGYVGWAPGPDWQVKGVADFNGDGYGDMLLQNSKDSSCYVWEMNGLGFASGKSYGFVGWTPGADWQVKGTGDFNGDGKSDILLQNASTGACYVWEMNGLDFASARSYGYVGWTPGAEWEAKGTGDFNGDGKSDILLQNSKDGSCFVWEMDGLGFAGAKSYGFVGWVPGADWQVKGIGNFNGDAYSDILLQNRKDGACYIWEMKDLGFVETQSYGFVGWTPGVEWQVKGTGDFNGDGKSDILLQSSKDGSGYVWEINGKMLVDYGYVGWAPGVDWHIGA